MTAQDQTNDDLPPQGNAEAKETRAAGKGESRKGEEIATY
jgi:hypothetical protein